MTKKNILENALEAMIVKTIKEQAVIKEDPLMADIGKEAEGNYLVQDILSTLDQDEGLRQEILAAMDGAQTPEDKDNYNNALHTIDMAIRQKQGMIQILSKSKDGMPESRNPLKSLVSESVKQMMTQGKAKKK